MSMPPSGHPAPGILVPSTPATPSPNVAPRNPQPDAPVGVQPPSMQTLSTKRHDELLHILHDVDALPAEALMKSDLPEQADRLLTEINASREMLATTKRTRRFKLFDKGDDVNRLLAKLEIESRRGNLPAPYPIDKDPLGLEAWAAEHSADEVAVIAKEFPTVRNALSSAIKAETGLETELSTTGGTSDGRFIAQICPQVVECGPTNASIHKIDEHIAVTEIEPLKNIYRRTMENLLL